MTVYIEYVILDNSVIDYILLKTTLKTTGKNINRLRVVFSAILGAGFSLVFPLLSVNPVALVFIKVLSGLLLLLISAKFINFKDFYINSVVFVIYTFALGGGIIGIYTLFNIDYGSELSTATAFIPALVLVAVVEGVLRLAVKKKKTSGYIYNVELTLNGKSVKARGFLDTGNGVYDGNSPVIFCSYKLVDKLMDIKAYKNLKFVAVSSVCGQEKKPTVKLDSIRIYNDGKENIYYDITLCPIKKGFSGNYEVILHPDTVKE